MPAPPVLPAELEIAPLKSPPSVQISVPGSKSITNRALILGALAQGESNITGALASEDTAVMLEALQRLGFAVQTSQQGTSIAIHGRGGEIEARKATLYLANSGTSLRFLTALCALGSGEYLLDGVERMRQRPQEPLLLALQQLGVRAEAEFGNGCPPLRIQGRGRMQGGYCKLQTAASSQFLSALLMVSPAAGGETVIELEGALRPHYVALTTAMMQQWGTSAETMPQGYRIRPAQYQPQKQYQVEPDASSASYFFAAAALTGGKVCVSGLHADALQGDVRFATETLAAMGCRVQDTPQGLCVEGPPPGELKGIDRDMSAISDTSLTLAALAPFALSPTTVRNIAHTRLQECDRIHAVCSNMKLLGVEVEEFPDGFRIHPARSIRPARLETFADHRIAMSFALIGLAAPGIVIKNPACTAKTFPDFWQRLELLRNKETLL